MNSADIRKSFLDFFAERGHTIVPSASLMPDSPGLLFTNAGMNQFVPFFLGERAPDVSKWAGVKAGKDTRAADTQKCIRAGGKHNDLEDVGYDTYHHTLFEMLGNWSFGDYFKKESIEWGWELLTKVWGIPAKRLFATVYSPDKAKGDPADFDQEAYDIWAGIFKKEGLDPAVHIVNGNKKDNFWMMGDTGPCGPCSEVHFNLLPSDDEKAGRALVNGSSSRCIEIWNHVFIQFNANADGTFSPLAAKHVDTGMGFERVAGIHATTRGFKDFNAEPSNYNSDVFAPLFKVIAKLSGRTYKGTVPTTREGLPVQEATDVAFRVLADHARTVSCAIADGIMPGNDGRNYVIRRILRRGILYGTKIGLKAGFFEKLVAPVVETLGGVFPELKAQKEIICRVIRSEEESFGKTIDRGITLIAEQMQGQEMAGDLLRGSLKDAKLVADDPEQKLEAILETDAMLRQVLMQALMEVLPMTGEMKIGRAEMANPGATVARFLVPILKGERADAEELKRKLIAAVSVVPGRVAFTLYDTYGFPVDMTALLAAEKGLTVDFAGMEKLMEEQRERARAAQKKEVVVAKKEGEEGVELPATIFVGYEPQLLTGFSAKLVDVVRAEEKTFLVFDKTPFYAEMGGQLGDTGTVVMEDVELPVVDTVKDKAGRYLHLLKKGVELPAGACDGSAVLSVNVERRKAIQRHHTATHLLHWALRKVVGDHVRQAGSLNAVDYLRFDFSHFEAVGAEQLREIERLVNGKILENARVDSYETDFDKKPEGTLAFFGEKYGKRVRVVDVGGYSRELCGGTHVGSTGEIGFLKVRSEGAIAAGVRRIEAVAGAAAHEWALGTGELLVRAAGLVESPVVNFEKRLEQLLAQKAELEKKVKGFEQKASAGVAEELAAKAVMKDGMKWVSAVVVVESPEVLRSVGSQVLGKIGEGVVKLGAEIGGKASVVVFCSPAAVKGGMAAGKMVAELCAKLGGKGGGKPDFAMGGGKEVGRLREVLAR